MEPVTTIIVCLTSSPSPAAHKHVLGTWLNSLQIGGGVPSHDIGSKEVCFFFWGGGGGGGGLHIV